MSLDILDSKTKKNQIFRGKPQETFGNPKDKLGNVSDLIQIKSFNSIN